MIRFSFWGGWPGGWHGGQHTEPAYSHKGASGFVAVSRTGAWGKSPNKHHDAERGAPCSCARERSEWAQGWEAALW